MPKYCMDEGAEVTNVPRLSDRVKEFFAILDVEEESVNGSIFHPTYIGSCRAVTTARLVELLPEMRKLAEEDS